MGGSLVVFAPGGEESGFDREERRFDGEDCRFNREDCRFDAPQTGETMCFFGCALARGLQ